MQPNIRITTAADTNPRTHPHPPITPLHDIQMRQMEEPTADVRVNQGNPVFTPAMQSVPLPVTTMSSPANTVNNSFPSHATIMSSPSDATVANISVPLSSVSSRRSGSSGSCSMLSMFVVISGVTVAVACITIWIISYVSAQQIAAELSNHLRTALMEQSLARIETELSAPLVIVDTIRSAMVERIPNLTDRVSMDHDPAFFIDIANAAIRWPSISRFTFANQRGLALKWETPIQVKSSEKYSLESVRTMAIGITTPVESTQSVSPFVHVYPDAYSELPRLPSVRTVYTPHRIHSTLRFNPPFTLVSDIQPTDTKEDVKRYLGEPKLNTSFDRLDSLTWLASLEIHASKRDTGWTLPMQMVTVLNQRQFLSMSACSVARSPHSGNMGATACVAIAMEYLSDLLSDLRLGQHGKSFLMTSAGNIVASGSKDIQALAHASSHGFPIDQLQDGITPVLTRKLKEWGLIQPNKLAGTLNHSIGAIDQQEETPRSQMETELTLDDVRYHMRASMINFGKVGLPMTLMQYTQDSDFAASVHQSDQTIACVCCGALLFAVIISFVSALLFIRPLTQVIHFLTLTSDIVTTLDPHEHREQLIQLQKQFSQTSKCMPQANNHTASLTGEQVEVRIHKKDESPGHIKDASTSSNEPQSEANSDAKSVECSFSQYWDRLVKYLEVEEAHALQRAFFFMISSLISIDTLQLVNEAKKAFIRYIFHEVRVPFSAMVLGLEQMRLELQHMPSVPPSVNETIDVLQEQAEFITRILNEVLTMQKIEANQTELERSYFSMNQLIESTVHTFQVACESKGLHVNNNLQSLDDLITRLASSDSNVLPTAVIANLQYLPLGELKSDMITNAYVEADVHRMRQVLSNFLSNAIKFTPRLGEVKVNLLFSDFEPNEEVRPSSTAVEVNDEEELIQSLAESHKNSVALNSMRSTVARIGSIMMYVSVVDTGIGISEEDAKNLFQPYRQIASVHQKKLTGTGLGLSIAKSIVKLHGGVIGVQSSPGQGSEFFFRVRLPVAAVTHPPHMHHRLTPMGRGSPVDEPVNGGIARGTPTVAHSPMLIQHAATPALSPFPSPAAPMPSNLQTEPNISLQEQQRIIQPTLRLEPLTQVRAVSGSRSASDAVTPIESVDTQFLSVPRTISYEMRNKELESPRDAYSAKSAGSSPGTQSFLQGLRILVAEDSLPNRRLILQLLRSMKCDAVGVENGAECCDAMSHVESGFDCILMDGCMPVMDGLEATRTLRQRGCNIPIIGLTGHALAEDVNAFLQAGADAVYTKPISRKQLQMALKQHVKANSSRKSPTVIEEKNQEMQSMAEQKHQ